MYDYEPLMDLPTNNFEFNNIEELKQNAFGHFAFLERMEFLRGNGGVKYRFLFDNLWGASVIKTRWSYGGDLGLYEIAVFNPRGEINTSTEIIEAVLGYCSPVEIVLGYCGPEEIHDALVNISKL